MGGGVDDLRSVYRLAGGDTVVVVADVARHSTTVDLHLRRWW
ncbi:MAG TPA: hypothetical protein VHT75_02945 [Acidimicrobiales bacterium]|nr:hypothetical protein [Acidimicrobiales bacterium]